MQVHEIFFPRRNCKIHRGKLSVPLATAYQMSSTHRPVGVFDWLADTAGAVAAAFLWQTLTHKLQTREKSLAIDKTTVRM